MAEFSDFRGLLAALPSGSLALDDVGAPEFCFYEDHRIVAYYTPFDYLNRLARVAPVASGCPIRRGSRSPLAPYPGKTPPAA